MSLMGHKRTNHRWPKSTFVRSCPKADKREPINGAGPQVSSQSVQSRNVDLASEASRIDAMRRTAKSGHEEISPSFRVGGQVVYPDDEITRIVGSPEFSNIDFGEFFDLVELVQTNLESAEWKQHAAYSITSSARASSIGGTARPIALAVLRLITSSNLVGCSIGRSLGFAPLKILSATVAARRNSS